MPGHFQKFRELENQLTAIQVAWDSIGAEYDDPDPSIKIVEEGWQFVTTVDYSGKNTSDYRPFARAWADTLDAARDLFTGAFAAWAAEVVKTCGIERFPIDCGDPPTPRRIRSLLGQESLAQSLTGSSDTVVAGLRFILWAAASRVPDECRRPEGYVHLIFRWLPNLLQFGNQRCQTYSEPFSWIRRAFAHLEANDLQVEGPWSEAKSPAQWSKEFGIGWDTLKKLFDDQKIRNQMLTQKNYRVHIADLPHGRGIDDVGT